MSEEEKISLSKSLRGVNCPMNLVYAKVALREVEPGGLLEIILDDGPPINNVPGSLKKEGHQVLSQTRLEDGSWSLIVRKLG